MHIFRALSALLLAVATIAQLAANTTWHKPFSNNRFRHAIVVEQADLTDTATILTLRAVIPQGQWVSVSPETYIRDKAKTQFALKGAEGIVPGERHVVKMADGDVFKLIFEPMPQDIPSLDMIEPRGWRIDFIRPQSYLETGIVNTNWRDTATGNWLIGFYKEKAVYDSQVWDIVEQKEKGDKHELLLQNAAGERLKVKIDKLKGRERKITIDGHAAVCDFVGGERLGDYPAADPISEYANTHFASVDTAYVNGWLKDMDRDQWKKGSEVKFIINNPILAKGTTVSAPLDSLGRFEAAVPLMAPTRVLVDQSRSGVEAPLEPGQHYFLLRDFSNGQTLWMGPDARVQNEFGPDMTSKIASIYSSRELPEADVYQANFDASLKRSEERQAKLKVEHPTLSERTLSYIAIADLAQAAYNLMQAQSHISLDDKHIAQLEGDILPLLSKAPVQSIYSMMAPHQYNFYIQHKLRGKTGIRRREVDVLRLMEMEGKIKLTPEESATVARYNEEFSNSLMPYMREPDSVKMAALERFGASPTSQIVNAVMERTDKELFREAGLLGFHRLVLREGERLGLAREWVDLVNAENSYSAMEMATKPLDPIVVEFFNSEVPTPVARDIVLAEHQKYVDLQNSDFSNLVSLRSAEIMEGMSEGGEILKKILEPFRGKIALIDVWGSWCGPCRAALSNSRNMYEELADYDLAYVYLANRTDDEAWKMAIQQYGMDGANIANYNLPEGQQSAVETILDVHSYPSYRIIDREGHLLDLDVDARNIASLKAVLDKMK